MQFYIRAVKLDDVPAIVSIHADSEGPWADPVHCAIAVNHRLLRPFLCYVVEFRGEVIGHAEWIVGDEPTGRQLYLGMLQIRPDWRGQGVGRRLVEHGVELGCKCGCCALRTVPEEGVETFYRKCGLSPVEEVRIYSFKPRREALPSGWRKLKTVPKRVTLDLPMRLGWVQGCSAHMWEICNRPVRVHGDEFLHPCLGREDRTAYVQLRYSDRSEALVLGWAGPETTIDELVQAANSLAVSHSVSSLSMAVTREDCAQVPAEADLTGHAEVWSRSLISAT